MVGADVGRRIAAFTCLALLSASISAEVTVGRVIGVSDGDTVTVLSSENVQHKIRLSGIDAPERAQPFGQRAKEKMAELTYGKMVSVDWSKRDRYQRLVGKVTVGEVDAGLVLIRTGLAWHYKRYEQEQPPADRESYAAAEHAARRSQVGLWSDTSPIPPWNWRAAKRGN